jgi:hypothetical protein
MLMKMKEVSGSTSSGRTILNVVFLIITVGSLFIQLGLTSAIPNVPYPLDVRWTHLEKTGVPVKIGFEEIPLGSDWTYECMLISDYKYHIYCIGNWTDLENPDTDYDIYVYDEDANLLSTHTESAGLPEQVSNDVDQRYFSPAETGFYSFRVRNDAMESQNSRNATFLIIQHLEHNTVYRKNMMGRDNYDNPVLKTSIAYEFNASADLFEIYVKVPSTLDMYEARIYPMTNLDEGIGDTINGALIPWDPGLHGELQGETTKGKIIQLNNGSYGELVVVGPKKDDMTPYDPDEHGEIEYAVGGFNTEAEGYRPSDAFASCESLGQDMVLLYNNSGNTLYHLVLIAEHGSGKVSFYVKTDFDPPNLQLVDPPTEAYSDELTPISISVKDESLLKSLYVKFTDDDGENWSYKNMTQDSGNVYGALLPYFSEGDQVEYTVVAVDEVDNRAEVDGGFQVLKERPEPTTINCHVDNQEVKQNREMKVTGEVTPKREGITVTLRFVSSTTSHTEMTETDPSGVFSCSFKPPEAGTWSLLAEVKGDGALEPAQSAVIEFDVTALTLLDKIRGMIFGTLLLMMEPPYLYMVYGATSVGVIIAVYKISGRVKEKTRKGNVEGK